MSLGPPPPPQWYGPPPSGPRTPPQGGRGPFYTHSRHTLYTFYIRSIYNLYRLYTSLYSLYTYYILFPLPHNIPPPQGGVPKPLGGEGGWHVLMHIYIYHNYTYHIKKKKKKNYMWHTQFIPVWLDPQMRTILNYGLPQPWQLVDLSPGTFWLYNQLGCPNPIGRHSRATGSSWLSSMLRLVSNWNSSNLLRLSCSWIRFCAACG